MDYEVNMRSLNIMAGCLGAAILLAPPIAAQTPEEDPIAVAGSYVDAMQASDFDRMATLMHPASLAELREIFDDPDQGRRVHLHLGVDDVSGSLQLCLGAHWRFEGYLPQALADLAAHRGFGWVILEPGRYLFS